MSITDIQPSDSLDLPLIPDDLTLAEFMLNHKHTIQPQRDRIPCMVDEETGRTTHFWELKNQTRSLANGLSLQHGIGVHDTVMLLSPNHTSYPVAMWAVHELGGIVTCSNPQFSPEEIAWQLQIARVTFIIVHSCLMEVALVSARLVGLPTNRIILLNIEDGAPVFSNVPNVPDLLSIGVKRVQSYQKISFEKGDGKSKIALLSWSSGTTGKPKAVAISHYAIIANIIQMAAHNQVGRGVAQRRGQSFRPGDVALGVLPFYHNAGLVISLHLVLFSAMTLVVASKYDFIRVMKSISRYRISHLFLVPPQAITFCKHPDATGYNLDSVRYVMIGAAPLSDQIQENLHKVFPRAQIGQAYGLTEAVCTVSMIGHSQRRGPLGSGGRMLPGVVAKTVRPDGSHTQLGEPGELIVKSPSAALGYLNDALSSATTFRDGWLHTGDEAILTSNGEIFVIDRLKEFLKVRGFQVAPAELEGCILSHPDVTEACVVGIADEHSGELPLAFIVLTPSATEYAIRDPIVSQHLRESILKHVATRKASYKRLTGVRFVDKIPRNGSGKIMRRFFREAAKRFEAEPRIEVQAKL